MAKPKAAKLTGPHPKSNAIFGFVIGLLLGAFAAYLLGRLDRRLRSLARDRSGVRDADPDRAAGGQASARQARGATRRPRSRCARRCGGCRRRSRWAHPVRRSRTGPRERDAARDPVRERRSRRRQVDAGRRAGARAARSRRARGARRGGLPQAGAGEAAARQGQQGLADVLAGRLTVEEAMQEVAVLHPGAAVGAPQRLGCDRGRCARGGRLGVAAGGDRSGSPIPPRCWPARRWRSCRARSPRTMTSCCSTLPVRFRSATSMPLLARSTGSCIVARVGHTRETSAAASDAASEANAQRARARRRRQRRVASRHQEYGVSEQYGRGLASANSPGDEHAVSGSGRRALREPPGRSR